jgi:hypothetical protein
VLTSITSNEPDNGLGDGDFPNDIQGASFGTPDTHFQLRSERSGTGSGRTYTALCTAADASGNTSADTAVVRVPHDQGASAKSGSGYNSLGTALLLQARTFDIVVLSLPAFSAGSIDTRTAQVGNTTGVLSRLKSRLSDVNADGLPDLIFTFPAAPANELRKISGAENPLALRFVDAGGRGYLVPDIYKLGSPLQTSQ